MPAKKSKNSAKMIEKVEVSDTTPEPPIDGEKNPVSRIKDKNLEEVSTIDHIDEMELSSSNNTYLLGQNHERLPG